MATINRKNFPGVYSQIIDESFNTTTTQSFRPGLIGVASKGPFDTPTTISTVQDFVRVFGQPIPGDYFLGTAVGIVSPFTNGSVVVRVGLQYQDLPVTGYAYDVVGSEGGNTFTSLAGPMLNPSQSPTGNVFIQITQDAKVSTINAQVQSVSGFNGTNVTLFASDTLEDNYSAGSQLKISYYENAAANAQGLLQGYVWGSALPLGTVSGTKGNYYFTVSQNPTSLVPGNLIRITQSGSYATEEVYVSAVNPVVSPSSNGVAVIQLQTTDDTQRGYQALPLQDNYSNATVSVATSRTNAALIYAITPGTWANTAAGSPPTGLQVKVGPGTQPGTKKLNIYSDSALVEVYDNLGVNPYSLPNIQDFEQTINVSQPSNYITIKMLYAGTNPANSVSPWNLTPSLPILDGSPVNDAATAVANGGFFEDGYNGEQAQASDFVGKLDPVTDTMTGLKAFEDTDNVIITALCAPGITSTDSTMLPVHTQIRDTAAATKSIGLIDIPNSVSGVPLTIWNAIDWCNGAGQFKSRGLLNSPYLAAFWNWFYMNDPITQQQILAPPTVGVLRAMAYTWQRDQPWYAAAGVNRGVINEATAVQFPKISESAKQASYGNGNVVNVIQQSNGAIMVFGEQTMLRIPPGTTDKLTAVHNLVLVEYVVRGLSAIGRRFVFDPNDITLLNQINLAMNQFLKGIVNLRGIEAYNLVCDTSNNTATTRNNREVIVDLYVIPTDSVERIYINAVVRESGADLTSVT